jgi:hypothetical protein
VGAFFLHFLKLIFLERLKLQSVSTDTLGVRPVSYHKSGSSSGNNKITSFVWTLQIPIIPYTGYNRIRYTTVKIYRDQKNTNITPQFFTEHFFTLQIFLQVFNIAAIQSSGDHRIHSKSFKFTRRWIGRGSCIPWPPRSPNLTLMDFSFWGFMKDNVYIPPMPVDFQELCDRIVNAIALVHVTFLGKL